MNQVSQNPLKTRSDVQEAVRQLIEPLQRYFSTGGALLTFGEECTQAWYEPRAAAFEAFSRPLWGLAPLLAGGGETHLWSLYVQGFRNGSNPAHPEYWGESGDFEQRNVEMAALSMAMLLLRDRLQEELSDDELEGLSKWLYQINDRQLPDNNWLFFRVLVNISLKKAGLTYSAELLERDLNRIDDFYLGNGWYSDGATEQLDYYIPFAMHYYGLIYAQVMKEEDPKRAAVYRERAAIFAKDFIHWFSSDGSALPFGRSLAYRFAQVSFWSACVFAGVEVFSWGVMKGLILRHLRWWFAQPIFHADGVLSVGYTYPNLNMSEFYNAYGSPYWAFKAFLPLAMDESHPFWQAEEERLPELLEVSVQQHPHMILQRFDLGHHVVALTAGQYANFEPTHNDAKYGKFAYSTLFGFSTPRGSYGLIQGAYDSMLALCENDDGLYRVRRRCEKIALEGHILYSLWKPWQDVEVQTWLVPAGSWHVRVHHIRTARMLTTAEGGFAIRRERDRFGMELLWSEELEADEASSTSPLSSRAAAAYPWGVSGVVNLLGKRSGKLVLPEPNTNLLHPHTVLPTLTGDLERGEHWLATAVLGEGADGTVLHGSGEVTTWHCKPTLFIEEEYIVVISSDSVQPIARIPLKSAPISRTMR
ncbi:DUF2264 domain-containing protein [Paenibacillus swuensis]|uniref:DUF2264 domain-containing protein n=1 Tax=Paenibacillus swuensis TaxID=1178515 RepID=UPI0008386006|nr:DUF2264 domain-containing protein [Paenibacillus swuensis]